MATAALSGKAGTVTVGTLVSEVRKWNAELTVVALDATSFDSNGWIECIEGLKGGTVEFDSLTDEIAVGIHTACIFALPSGPTVTGDVLIESGPIAVEVDGILEYSYRGKFTGEIT